MAAVVEPEVASATEGHCNPLFLSVLGGVQACRAIGDALKFASQQQQGSSCVDQTLLSTLESSREFSSSPLLKPSSSTCDHGSPAEAASCVSAHPRRNNRAANTAADAKFHRDDYESFHLGGSSSNSSNLRFGHRTAQHPPPPSCHDDQAHLGPQAEARNCLQQPHQQLRSNWGDLFALASALLTVANSSSGSHAAAASWLQRPHEAVPWPAWPHHHHHRHHERTATTTYRNHHQGGQHDRLHPRKQHRRQRQRDGAGCSGACPPAAGPGRYEGAIELREQVQHGGHKGGAQQKALAQSHRQSDFLSDATAWLQAATVCAGAASRTLAQCVIHPLDTLKTRMQVRMPTPQLQVWRAVMTCPVSRPRALMAWLGPAGLRDMFLGLGAAVAGTLPASALYFGTEQAVRSLLAEALKTDRDAAPCRLAASASAATLSALVRVPADVVKHRVQAYAYPSATQAARAILSSRGPAGLYAGFGATLLRDAPEIVLQFTLYSQLKALLEAARSRHSRGQHPDPAGHGRDQAQAHSQTHGRRNSHHHHHHHENKSLGHSRTAAGQQPRLVVATARGGAAAGGGGGGIGGAAEHMLLGGAAGAAAALVTTPLDVVKTQLQCGAAASVPAALAQVVRSGGPAALFGGVAPRVLQTALCSALFFACFEASKAQLGQLAAHRTATAAAVAPALPRRRVASPPQVTATAVQRSPSRSLSPSSGRRELQHPHAAGACSGNGGSPRLRGCLGANSSFSGGSSFSSAGSDSGTPRSCSGGGGGGGGSPRGEPLWLGSPAEVRLGGQPLAPVAAYAYAYAGAAAPVASYAHAHAFAITCALVRAAPSSARWESSGVPA